MECDPHPEILYSIFNKESPLHDGGILISNGKIVKASFYLPLSVREDLPQEWGTRHRAALGLSEQCDAGVLIVSEERGEISVFMDNTIQKIKDPDALSTLLAQMSCEKKEQKHSIKENIKFWFTRQYKIKASIFMAVFVLWLVLAGQQNFERDIEISMRYKNVPANLVVAQPLDQKITITCRGLRKDVSLLNENNSSAFMELLSAQPGAFSYTVNPRNINLPNNRVQVVNITPAKVEINLVKK
jgi:hypothetical protein